MHTLLSLLVLAASSPAQGTLTANVNDARSHGTLGDAFLSLDEAVQLYNGTILLTQLSVAESARVVGLGPVLDRIEVDAAVVPRITFQANLSTILGPVAGVVTLDVQGIAGPTGRPVLDAATFAAALPVTTNLVRIHGFSLRNGQTGITADARGRFQPFRPAEFGDLDLEGQSQAGFSFSVPASPVGQSTIIKVHDVTMQGLPVGYLVTDQAMIGSIVVVSELVRLENVRTGVDLIIGATGGGTSFVEFFRSDMIGSDTCLRIRRTTFASDSEVLVRHTIGTYTASRNVFDVQGVSLGNTILHWHHLDVRAGSGATDHALLLGPATARFDVVGAENVVDGNVTILAGTTTRRLALRNSVFRNGTMTVDNMGVPPELAWNIFESYPITALASSRTPFTISSCELVRSPVHGASSTGHVTLAGCFQGSSPVTGSVTVNSPAPSRWIGQSSVAPKDPPIGTFVDLMLDLQPGMGGVWVLAVAEHRPATSNYPFRFYLKPSSPLVLPQLHTLRDRVRLTIPRDSSLIGAELYAQALNLPLLGQTWAPPVTLPRGGHFKLTR